MRGATSGNGKIAQRAHDFNPRAPCGARHGVFPTELHALIFQSTRPMRGATHKRRGLWRQRSDFNPRAPCGARPTLGLPVAGLILFQSTRPMRGATAEILFVNEFGKFQSTRPMRGATSSSSPSATLSAHFNPRAPCGARRSFPLPSTSQKRFQSTRPMRGATGSQND